MRTQWAHDVIAFIRLGRPHFLAGGFVMHAVGVAAALYAGANLHPAALLWGQVVITATQWMVHYANDYFDLAADRANRTPTAWSGGSRVLAEERLPARVALVTALILALIALAAGLVLVLIAHTGPFTLPLVALLLFLAWGYSAPPFTWHTRGLGELATALIVPVLTPILGCYLQAGYVPGWLPLALLPLFCLQLGMLLAVNFPDAAGDAATGKRTLVVRLGRGAAWLYALMLTAAYVTLPLLRLAGLPPLTILAMALPAPLAAWLAWRVLRGGWTDPRAWGSTAFASIALLMLTASLEAGALTQLSGWLRL
jgi:1,4-dihydroxy-2-naphthoate octaprenyltransferase